MKRGLMLVAGMGLVVSVSAQQARPPQDTQPGRKWSEEQLKKAASAVRAGRTLTPKAWPNGARVAVCLTFVVNNSANQLARGDSAVVAMTNGEFGAASGLGRVLEVLDRQNVPATFFVPAVAAMLHPQMLQEIAKRKRHEIGVMGWSDENPTELSAAEEEQLLTKATEYLTKTIGKKPVGARGPSAVLSMNTMSLFKKAGFLYDSTLMGMDEPYEVLINGEASGIVELPVSRLLDDYPTLTAARTGPSTLPSPELVFESIRDDFDGAYQEGTLFLLTLHPHLIGMRSRITYLDDLLTFIKSRPNVWMATGEEIARYVKNPTGKTN